ncbi:DUF4279 domain-containing protein [Alicyclobacillus cycloheptanicus]|nr:DUF4279 domain-containing protein [Alicyclobacillus cycloheptanicus]
MVEFDIIGDMFPLDKVTEELSVAPSGKYVKGEPVTNRNGLVRKETCWYVSTGYQESLDIGAQLNKIVGIFKNKIGELNLLQKEYDLEFKIFVVIRVENNQMPAIYLNAETIRFAHSINAEFDFDVYIH